MWILTGLLLGSIITSTHDSEEACRGRAAMLTKVKEVQSIECRATQIHSYSIISSGTYILGR